MKYKIIVIWAAFLCAHTFCSAQVRRGYTSDPVLSSISPAIQGKITIANDVLMQMQQQWQTSPAQLPGNAIQVQLWQVTYQQDGRNTQATNIILQQKVNAGISFDPQADGIAYKITDAPAMKNLAVIVTCNALATVPDMILIGFPNDGRGKVPLHQYKTDAGKHFGPGRLVRGSTKGIYFGIYSIIRGKTNTATVNFAIASSSSAASCKNCDFFGDVSSLVQDIGQAVSTVVNGITYIFDQEVDGVANLAVLAIQTVGQGIVQFTEYYIDQTGKIYYVLANTLIGLIEYGNLPQIRSLNDWEYNWANVMIFNNTLPSIDKILVFNFMSPDNHRFYTLPSLAGDMVYMNMGDAFASPTTYTNPIYQAPGEVFIHELTHAWQIGHYGAASMLSKYIQNGGPSQPYSYPCTSNAGSNLGIEQQAQLTNDLYTNLYYPQTFYKNIQNNYCGFELSWVQINIRNSVPFDTAEIYATVAMRTLGTAIPQFVGNVSGAVASPSPGNAQDKGGYYIAGSTQGSMLYCWSRAHQATVNWGDIRNKYLAFGAERGLLGWPNANPGLGLRANGSFQQFQRGYIYSIPTLGTYVITEPIFDTWAKQNFEKGPLGYPISDYIPDNPGGGGPLRSTVAMSGGQQKFERGIIVVSIRTGQTQTQVILNDQLIKGRLANATAPASNTSAGSQPPPSQTTGAIKKLTPGEKNALNPQPLPPTQPVKTANQ